MAETLSIEVALKLHRAVLIDTCVLIDEFNNPTGILRAINRAQRRTSMVALWEFLHGSRGASLGLPTKHARGRWLDGQGVVVVDLSRRCNLTFRSLLRGQGPPGAVDCLLAAESLARSWPLVTSNVNDFLEVAGLRVVPV